MSSFQRCVAAAMLLALSGCVAPVAQLAASASQACATGCGTAAPNVLSLDWQSKLERAAAALPVGGTAK